MSVIVKLELCHLEHLSRCSDALNTPLAANPQNWPQLLALPSWALIDEGEALGCGGIVNLWRGVGEAWVFASSSLIFRPVLLGRGVLRTLEYVQSQGTYHRLQMTTPKKPEMCRWATFLGFHLECVLRKYLWNGEDRYLFARIYGS